MKFYSKRDLIPALIFFVGGVALIRDTAYNGHDFAVFWQAARSILEGQPIYSVARDGNMVFKYPPWIAPFFLPFGLVPLHWAKWIWGGIEVFSLLSVIAWLLKVQKCRKMTCVGLAISYWGLWAIHALDGQIALVMLALSLWLWRDTVFEKFNLRSIALFFTLSVKIFTLYPLCMNRWSRKFFCTLGWIALGALIFSFPAWWASHQSPSEFISSWSEAAASGGRFFSAYDIRGTRNQGFPALILRILGVPAAQSYADLIAFIFCAFPIGFFWPWASKSLRKSEIWLGWLALVPAVHPLPWGHLFVFSFPLAVTALERAIQNRQRSWIGLCVLGILLILSNDKTLAPVGMILAWGSGKSWGILLCAISLVFTNFSLSRKSTTG